MLAHLFSKFCRISPKLKGAMWKRWYQFIARSYRDKEWKFMNYGYAPLAGQLEFPDLAQSDTENLYCIQLYHHLASSIDLRKLDVLEIGSGRGGGADYIMRTFKPNTMVGVDISKSAVEFCHLNYAVDGLSFEIGDAEALPFGDESFDVVINVESSYCYGSMMTFLGEVRRVLRKGGYFLLTDFRGQAKVDLLRERLAKSGLTIIKETDITPNIVAALRLDHENRTTMIKNGIHRMLVPSFLEFAGTRGSKTYANFDNRETLYLSFVLQK
jgi:SAM-dependent methyltransferase